MPESEFVTVSEAARALGLSERQVRRYAGRLAESDRLPAQSVRPGDRPTPDATTGPSPARVRLSALALLAGKVIAEESTPEKASGSSPAPAGHDDRLPAESVRPVSGVASEGSNLRTSGPLVSEDLATLREQLASVTAERDGLTARLADTQADRDAWKEQAQTLTEALRAAQDEARAARLIGGRPMQQIEAQNLTAGDSGASEASGGPLDTPDTVKVPWWAFWKGRG